MPVGVPAPGATAATVAVKLTVCPKTEGLGLELTDVWLPDLPTACGKAGEVPVVKFASPA